MSKEPHTIFHLKKFKSSLGINFERLIRWDATFKKIQIRLMIVTLLCAISIFGVWGRLFTVMILGESYTHKSPSRPSSQWSGEIVDRNGTVLATHLKTASIYAIPHSIQNPIESANKIAAIIPSLNIDSLLRKLQSGKGFTWIARHISPDTQQKIHTLGIPGIYMREDRRRIYPNGELFSHILGYCDIDGNPLGGIESAFKKTLEHSSIMLSIDLRLQHIVFEALQAALEEFEAIAANAMVIDLKTGELLACISLPTFNSNRPDLIPIQSLFNRNTMASLEPGSVFKILNVAIALESGSASLTSQFDARKTFWIGRFPVNDFKGQNRILSLTESFVFSSNIAAIKIAQTFGAKTQKDYMTKFGVLTPISIEVPENGKPQIPKDWRDTTALSVSYGYGISVTPLQLLTIVGGLINDGIKIHPTIIKKSPESHFTESIISPKTSSLLRKLMRLVVTEQTGRKANIEGYGVFGKTGTAYQSNGRGYGGSLKKRTTTFIGAFPFSCPRYGLLVMLDDPKGSIKTHGYATAGWNAAAVAGHIIRRIGPLLTHAEELSSDIISVPGWYAKPSHYSNTD